MLGLHWPRDVHWSKMMRLPRWRRPFSKRGRKHLIGCCIGVGMMLTGSGLAVSHLDIVVPHVVWDCFAYFVHGIGAIPILAHIEPLWAMFTE